MNVEKNAKFRRVGFVSTRISGTDGVSLETKKWAEILEAMGLECYYITGQSDREDRQTWLIEEAHFEHPTIKDIHRRAFGSERRDCRLTSDVLGAAERLRGNLYEAIETHHPGVGHPLHRPPP